MLVAKEKSKYVSLNAYKFQTRLECTTFFSFYNKFAI